MHVNAKIVQSEAYCVRLSVYFQAIKGTLHENVGILIHNYVQLIAELLQITANIIYLNAFEGRWQALEV